jgi:hypothetical protein
VEAVVLFVSSISQFSGRSAKKKRDKQLDFRSVCVTPLEIPSSSLPRFVCRRHSDGLGKEGELFVEQHGLDKDVLHPALPLRHKRTPWEHGRTVNTRPLVLRCESQRIVSTLALLQKLNVTASYGGPVREHTKML